MDYFGEFLINLLAKVLVLRTDLMAKARFYAIRNT